MNGTPKEVRVHIADFNANMTPGGEQTIDAPFGSYLALGVHTVGISSLAGGAEIWLIEKE